MKRFRSETSSSLSSPPSRKRQTHNNNITELKKQQTVTGAFTDVSQRGAVCPRVLWHPGNSQEHWTSVDWRRTNRNHLCLKLAAKFDLAADVRLNQTNCVSLALNLLLSLTTVYSSLRFPHSVSVIIVVLCGSLSVGMKLRQTSGIKHSLFSGAKLLTTLGPTSPTMHLTTFHL